MKRVLPYVLVGAILAVILGVEVAVWVLTGGEPSGKSAVASPSPTEGVIPASYADIVPVPSVSPTTSSSLPETASAFLANFYTAYAGWDEERLAASFTADTAESEKPYRQRLLTGGLAEVASSYSVVESAAFSGGWRVTVKENRRSAAGAPAGEKLAIITLEAQKNQENGPWLISSYVARGSSGKYSGFLLQ